MEINAKITEKLLPIQNDMLNITKCSIIKLLMLTFVFFGNGCKNRNGKTQDNSNESLPILTLKENSFNFGEISQEDSVQHVFKIENDGQVPLIIKSAKASCGCTTPIIPKHPILPGKSDYLKVTFKPGKKVQGFINKSIVIMANTNDIFHVLYIKGNVTEGS